MQLITMTTPRYDIYFRGEIADGQNLATVKANLAKIFQADEKKIATLFSGKTCLLKKEIDKEAALKYQTILKKAGAKIIIKTSQARSSTSSPAPSPTPANSPQSKQPSLKERLAAMEQEEAEAGEEKEEEIPEGLYLVPVGSNLLKPSEQKEPETADIDTSAIDLRAPDYEPPEVEKIPVPAPDISGISVADAGEDLLIEKALEIDLPFPDIAQLDIDEVGVRLSEEKEEIVLPELDLSDMSIAEPGVRLSKKDSAPPPQAPDTSSLTLVPEEKE